MKYENLIRQIISKFVLDNNEYIVLIFKIKNHTEEFVMLNILKL
jgi:hypothetical protein